MTFLPRQTLWSSDLDLNVTKYKENWKYISIVIMQKWNLDRRIDGWHVTLGSRSRSPICNPMLALIEDCDMMRKVKTSRDMIRKLNSLKLTCDLGKWVKVTHMHSHPSHYRGLYSCAIWKSWLKNFRSYDLETRNSLKLTKDDLWPWKLGQGHPYAIPS